MTVHLLRQGAAPLPVVLALLLGLVLAPSAGASPTQTSTPRAVVELYTSQGCSSCPPADKLLAELAREPDLIALTLPVDYWDYLGWKDTLAHSAFSARQRAYAGSRGDRQVFTPQMVVNGAAACVGSDRANVERLIGRSLAGGAGLPVPVRVSEADGQVTVAVEPGGGAASGEVWVLPVARLREVSIGRGENRGRAVAYANVVRGFHRLGAWRGGAERFTLPAGLARGDGDGYVALVQAYQDGRPGAVLGAAKGPGL